MVEAALGFAQVQRALAGHHTDWLVLLALDGTQAVPPAPEAEMWSPSGVLLGTLSALLALLIAVS